MNISKGGLSVNIVFIGCGNMGEALLKPIADSRHDSVFVLEKRTERIEALSNRYPSVLFASDLSEIKGKALIVFAVKPQDKENAKALLAGINCEFGVLSIMAGVKMSFFKDAPAKALIRAMPNLPAMIGKGITGVCATSRGEFFNKALEILRGAGEVVEVEECHMDLITAVSGSGPAYFFFLCQCLYEFAIGQGLDKEKADLIVRQLALGTADFMVKYSGLGFIEMRKRVTSKGGTTQAAFDVISQKGIEDALKEAFSAAKERAEELAQS